MNFAGFPNHQVLKYTSRNADEEAQGTQNGGRPVVEQSLGDIAHKEETGWNVSDDRGISGPRLRFG